MKALHVTSVLLFALSCPAQQPDQASSSPMQVSPDEAFEHLQNRVVPQYPEMGISNRILNNELLDIAPAAFRIQISCCLNPVTLETQQLLPQMP